MRFFSANRYPNANQKPTHSNNPLHDLIEVCRGIDRELNGEFEVVFVVDGRPDQLFELLARVIASKPFRSQLILLSRNLGSFAAIRCGLKEAQGETFGVMAADLQEPPELMIEFAKKLKFDQCDFVVGFHEHRKNPLISCLFSLGFWRAYKHRAKAFSNASTSWPKMYQPEAPTRSTAVCTAGPQSAHWRLKSFSTITALS